MAYYQTRSGVNTTPSPAFIDFEASSLDLITSYPIEVGLCLADGVQKSWLICPYALWHDWSASAEQLHGIARETLKQEGIQVREVAQQLNALLAGKSIFCDAWTYDSFWLHRLFRAAQLEPDFQLESISALLNPQQVQQWSAIRKQAIHFLGLPVHRAANDALILRETWLRLAGLTV